VIGVREFGEHENRQKITQTESHRQTDRQTDSHRSDKTDLNLD